MTTTHNPSDARMTAQAPYESLTSVADVLKALADGRRVQVRNLKNDEVWRDSVITARHDFEACIKYGCEYRAALPERAPVSAGGDAVAWQYRYLCPTEGPGDWTNARPEDVEYLRGASERYELRALGVIATPAEARGVGDGVTDAMVERAAKALQKVNDCSLLLWNELPDYGKDRLRDQARAALTAALAANKPDTRQAQAQGGEAALSASPAGRGES